MQPETPVGQTHTNQQRNKTTVKSIDELIDDMGLSYAKRSRPKLTEEFELMFNLAPLVL